MTCALSFYRLPFLLFTGLRPSALPPTSSTVSPPRRLPTPPLTSLSSASIPPTTIFVSWGALVIPISLLLLLISSALAPLIVSSSATLPIIRGIGVLTSPPIESSSLVTLFSTSWTSLFLHPHCLSHRPRRAPQPRPCVPPPSCLPSPLVRSLHRLAWPYLRRPSPHYHVRPRCPLRRPPPHSHVRPRHSRSRLTRPCLRRPLLHSHVRPRRSLSHLTRPCLHCPPPHIHMRPRRPLCLPHSPVRHRCPLRHLATPSPSRHTSAVVDAVPRLIPAPRSRPTTPSSSTVILDTSTRWSPTTWPVSFGHLIA
jgi:hypothetical protein